MKKILYTLFFLMLTAMILTNSQRSLYYALHGLDLWFTKMIPALFPFMILSGIMIRLHLTESFADLLYPVIYPFWKVSKNVTYAMIMGFLCGFPMGAKVTGDLLKRDMITEREAQLLLSFCNNIGPVYFLSFVMPLLKRRLLWPYLFGMYGLPFLYGLFLRHTLYRDLETEKSVTAHLQAQSKNDALSLFSQIDEAVTSSIQSILMLGGYMILFNLLNLVPDILAGLTGKMGQLPLLLAPILEITGGLGMLGNEAPYLSLILLPFGGLCCIAQTYSMIRHTSLSIHSYVMHKLILTGITIAYYGLWKIFLPDSFML